MMIKKCRVCGGTFVTKSKRRKYCSDVCRAKAGDKRERNCGQLCWRCQKAKGGSDCVWINGSKEVDGWKAKKTKIINADSVISSYRITYCPNFILG